MAAVNKLEMQGEDQLCSVRNYVPICLVPPAVQQSGHHLFAIQDSTQVRFIRMENHLGFTFNEIKQSIQLVDVAELSPDDIRKTIQQNILERRAKKLERKSNTPITKIAANLVVEA
jgi:DNA-binding transcriptional MerR regulator